jgi:hypothetical protein
LQGRYLVLIQNVADDHHNDQFAAMTASSMRAAAP